MRDTPGLRSRIITRNVPPQVTPTTIRRHGLFTPRGIFKRRHWNVRSLFGPDPIPEMPWSPIYLPGEGRSPASPISASPPPRLRRSRLNRSVPWELMPWPPELPASLLRPARIASSPESEVSFSAVFKKPMHAFSEAGGTPAVIRGPTRMYSSPESDASFSPLIEDLGYEYASSSEYDVSPPSTITGSPYGYRSSGSDRSSPSPVIKSRFRRSPSPFYESDSASSVFDTYSGTGSSVFDTYSGTGSSVGSSVFDTYSGTGSSAFDSRSASPYQVDESFDASRSLERTFGSSGTPAIFGRRRIITRDVPPEVTPTSARRYGLFTPRGIFKKGHRNVRRIPGSDPISELPWSPIYLPEYARSPARPISPSPSFPRYRFDRTMSWEKSDGLSPGFLRQPTISPSPKLTDSPLIKGPSRMYSSPESDAPVFQRPAFLSSFSESDKSPSPAIIQSRYGYRSSESDRSGRFHSDSSPIFDTDVSPYQLDMSPDTSSDISHTRTFGLSDTPAIMGRRRIITRNVPPEVTPTSARRYGLFTPRGIFKKGHWNIRRIPGSDPISELPWSPTYLPEYARSPASPIFSSPSPPFPRYRFNRTLSWEKSDGLSPELTDSPLIKGPSRMYSSPESDASFSPVFQRPAFAEYDSSSSGSPVFQRPAFAEYDSSPSDSPVFQRPAFAEYDSSSSGSPSPLIRGFQSPLFESPPAGYESDFERTPDSIRMYESSFSSDETERTPDRSFSPQYPGGLFQHASQFDDPLNRRMNLSEMFDSIRTPDRSFSPTLIRTPDRHFSPAGTSIPYIDSSSILDETLLYS